MAEIIKLDPDSVEIAELLEKSSICRKLLVIGIDSEDNDFYGVAGFNPQEMLFMIEKFKYFLIKEST